MPNLEFRPGVGTNLRVYHHGMQIGLIVDILDEWRLLAEPLYYPTDTLKEIAAKLDELNAKKGQDNG